MSSAHPQVVFTPDFFAFFSARFSLMVLAAAFFVSFFVSRLFAMAFLLSEGGHVRDDDGCRPKNGGSLAFIGRVASLEAKLPFRVAYRNSTGESPHDTPGLVPHGWKSIMRIAIIGHIPHDRYQLADGSSYTGLGGVLYGAAALGGAMGGKGEVVLVSRVGVAIEKDVRRLVGGYGFIEPRIDTVPYHGWVVHARYLDGEQRQERLVGGVSPWRVDELAKAVEGCDAVILNMVTGYEIQLPDFGAFAAVCPTLHLDFHSLAMGRDPSGLRFHAVNPHARQWCEQADVLQMNRAELRSVLPDTPPAEGAAELSSWGPGVVVITDGSNGVIVAEPGTVLHMAASDPTTNPVDPTGCGDVFGACFLVGLLRGESAIAAAGDAARIARRNADHRGIPTPQRLQEMFADW